MHSIIKLFAILFALATAGAATAQTVPPGKVITVQSFVKKTVSTSAAAAISASELLAGSVGWRICNALVQTSSTYLAVGKATSPLTDGVRLGPGKCLECPSCAPGTLTATQVVGQAQDDYTVIQFK